MKALLCFAILFGLLAHVSADTVVFVNGNIYTGNETQPHAEAVVAKDGRITFVGSSAEARKQAGADVRVIDLEGHTVLPGLTDAHCHIFGIGERELTLNLEGTKTRADFLAKVKERVAQTTPGKWVTGRGWIETFWSPPEFPSARELDEIAPENPVFLTRADGHAAIANSAALRAAGITSETAAPFGGEILKAGGAPTGMLIDNAMNLVAKNIPSPTADEVETALPPRRAAEPLPRLVPNPKRWELDCGIGIDAKIDRVRQSETSHLQRRLRPRRTR